MDQNNTSLKPPNLIKSFKEGFDAIANHIGLLLFPLGLDLFLWLGPHWRISRLIEQMLQTMAQVSGGGQTDLLRLGQEFWKTAAERINIFALLRTYPVGIFSLMAGVQPVDTPFGKPIEFQVDSIFILFLAWIILTLVGIACGTIFFSAVAQAALEGKLNWLELITSWFTRFIQVALLSMFWVTIIALISMPSSCLISVFALSNVSISQFAILIILGLLVWLLFPLLLSPHGIFYKKENVWKSIKQSVRITRFTFPTTTLLFLMVIVINQGLDIVWRLPKETSWFMVIGIAGHGFITSGLLAATFVYYRDAIAWVDGMLEKIKIASIS
ncbi:MAG: hypothetical protein ACPL3P_06040 [Anaerolineales bacterium]